MEPVFLLLGALAVAAICAILLLVGCAWCDCPNSTRPEPDTYAYAYDYAPTATSTVERPPWPVSVVPGHIVRAREQTAYKTRKEETEVLVRAEQDNILQELTLTLTLPRSQDAGGGGWQTQSPIPVLASALQGNYGLIIAADATPKQGGAYCIDLSSRTCSYYSLPLKQLPWAINGAEGAWGHDQPGGASDEFEMKNLLYALLVWLPEIRRFKKHITGAQRVLVCTDNFACRQSDNVYGRRVTDFLTHLRQCSEEDVLVDSRVYGTNPPNLRNHALFLKPADDFSRNCSTEAVGFLSQVYGLPPSSSVPVQIRPEAVQYRLAEECASCGFQIGPSPSLKSFRFTP